MNCTYWQLPYEFRYTIALGVTVMIILAIMICILIGKDIWKMYKEHQLNKPPRGRHARKTWAIMKR